MQSFYGLACAGSPMAQCYCMFARPSVWCDWIADCLSWSRTVSLGVKQSDPVQHALCMHCASSYPGWLCHCRIPDRRYPGRPFNGGTRERPHPGWLLHWKSPGRWLLLRKVPKACGYIPMSCDTLEADLNKVCCQNVQKLARKQEMLKRLKWKTYLEFRG
jgi:hypothetical protein